MEEGCCILHDNFVACNISIREFRRNLSSNYTFGDVVDIESVGCDIFRNIKQQGKNYLDIICNNEASRWKKYYQDIFKW